MCIAIDLTDIASHLTDWPSFVGALNRANKYWSCRWDRVDPVTGDTESWLDTITLGRAVMRRDEWSKLILEDRDLMLGLGDHGILGNMARAYNAVRVFSEATNDNLSIRETIREALQPVIGASDDKFAEAACAFIAKVNEIDGFAGGVATRFLALARPDRAISVNKCSLARLSELTGLQGNLASAPSYMDLLHWFEGRDWYSTPNPIGVRERLLATTRAALFDAFVYQY